MSYWAVPWYSPVIEQEVFGTWFIDVNCGVQKIHNGVQEEEKEEEEGGAHLEKSSRLKPSFCSWEESKSRAECELSCTLETTKYFPPSARPRAPQTPQEPTSTEPGSTSDPALQELCESAAPTRRFLSDIKAASGGTSITARRKVWGRGRAGRRGWENSVPPKRRPTCSSALQRSSLKELKLKLPPPHPSPLPPSLLFRSLPCDDDSGFKSGVKWSSLGNVQFTFNLSFCRSFADVSSWTCSTSNTDYFNIFL